MTTHTTRTLENNAYPLGDGTYRAYYRTSEMTKRKVKRGFKSLADANRWIEDELKVALTLGPRSVSGTLTVGEYVETRGILAATSRAATSARRECEWRRHIGPVFAHMPLADVTPGMIVDWEKAMLKKKAYRKQTLLSPDAVSTIRDTLSKIFTTAVKEGCIRFSPLASVPQPLRSRKRGKPFRPLESEEVWALADACGSYSTMILLLASAGLRIGEACALRVDDLDTKHNLVSIDEGAVRVAVNVSEETGRVSYRRGFGETKTDRSHRTVPVTGAVMDLLLKLADGKATDDLLFLNCEGNPLNPDTFRSGHFYPAVLTAGLPANIVPHSLRHTAASAWFDEGFDHVEVARFLGSSPETVERVYIHLYRGRVYKKMSRMEARWERPDTGRVVSIRKTG